MGFNTAQNQTGLNSTRKKVMLTGKTNREPIRPLVNGRIADIRTKDQPVWIEFQKNQSWRRTMIRGGAGLFASIMVIHQSRILAHEEGAPFSGAIIDPPAW